mmetsp:Transcript_86857/g.230086  ORF Transcript_86857/g.230086 Transcript_86857/m.230086 type:complete len:206 (-) Transcript_86857:36-653(-)
MSLSLSAPPKEAASTIVLRAVTRPATPETSICTKAAGFLAISLEIRSIARDRALRVSVSSASPAENSAASFLRISAALFSSPSAFAILPARSPILPSAASISLLVFVIVAASSLLLAVAVSMSYFWFDVVSSHHSTYLWNALSSASPSATSFAARESMSSMTLPRGFDSPAVAPRTPASAKMATRTEHFIAACARPRARGGGAPK